jgi:hypothetical protein
MGSRPPKPQIAAAKVSGHTVVLNGRAVQFDVAPRVVDGHMQVAFRSMFEKQGAQVSWNADTKTARLTWERRPPSARVGQSYRFASSAMPWAPMCTGTVRLAPPWFGYPSDR